VESVDTETDCVDGDMHMDVSAEAWSVTVNKDLLRTMTARDIKRQDHIWGEHDQTITHTSKN